MAKKKQTLWRGFYDENYNIVRWEQITNKGYIEYLQDFKQESDKLMDKESKKESE